MILLQNLASFLLQNRMKLLEQMLEHIGLTFLSLFLAVLLAMPAGIAATRYSRLAPPLLGIAGVLQTVPSIALLGFLLPFFGIGYRPAIIALFLYALLPIIRNTYTGIQEVDPFVKEAARGMGMTGRQLLTRVELPLALPVIFAGIRTATVINVGVATLAAYIGAGGLGEFIFGGIALNNPDMILAGAIPAALLAVGFDQALGRLQRCRIRGLKGPVVAMALALPMLALCYELPNWYTKGMKGGFEPEFMGRKDGYNKLVSTYGFQFNTVVLSPALLYQVVNEGFVDAIAGFSTDGRIKAYGLRVLEDDRHAFPPYYCTPIIRGEIARQYPEVVETLNLLGSRIDDSTMTELNYRVDFQKHDPGEVARKFLQELDLWLPDRTSGGPVLTIGSKIFTEQYILTELFAQLINGHTDLDVNIKPGLGGTQICFGALQQGGIDLYPEYTGTGFQVILEPDETTVQQLITDPDAVYDYVSKAFERQYDIRWLQPLGFNNTYALMMREDFAQKNGYVRLSDLGK